MPQADLNKEERQERRRGQRVRAGQNRIEAMKMRLRGVPFEAIGIALGVSISTAHGYVKKGLDDLAKELNQHSDRYRAFELRRLDALIEVYMADLHESMTRTIDNDDGTTTEIVETTTVIKPRIGALLLKAIDLRIDLLGIRRGRETPEDGAPRTSIEEALREIDEEEAPSIEFKLRPARGIGGPENGAPRNGGQEERKEDGDEDDPRS